MRKEIDEILRCIRFLNANNSESFITDIPSYLMRNSHIDYIELAKSRSFKDILKVIEKTKYYDVLKKIQPGENELIDYPTCEVALQTYYMNHQIEIIKKKFGGKVREDLIQLITMQTELNNIINAYRLKFFFNETPEAIISKCSHFTEGYLKRK